MFALVFKADDGIFGIDLVNVETVVPAVEFERVEPSELPFAGRLNYADKKLPLFDLNFALAGKPSRRMFGTRYIISKIKKNGADAEVAMIVESASHVAEFEDSEVSGNVGDAFRIGRSSRGELKIVGLESALGKSLEKYA